MLFEKQQLSKDKISIEKTDFNLWSNEFKDIL